VGVLKSKAANDKSIRKNSSHKINNRDLIIISGASGGNAFFEDRPKETVVGMSAPVIAHILTGLQFSKPAKIL